MSSFQPVRSKSKTLAGAAEAISNSTRATISRQDSDCVSSARSCLCGPLSLGKNHNRSHSAVPSRKSPNKNNKKYQVSKEDGDPSKNGKSLKSHASLHVYESESESDLNGVASQVLPPPVIEDSAFVLLAPLATLNKVIELDASRRMLLTFMKEKLCDENLMFIERVHKFERMWPREQEQKDADNFSAALAAKLFTDEDRMREAVAIFETFISIDSTSQVNIAYRTRTDLTKLVLERKVSCDMFRSCYDQTMTSIEMDAFQRFKKDDRFKTVVALLFPTHQTLPSSPSASAARALHAEASTAVVSPAHTAEATVQSPEAEKVSANSEPIEDDGGATTFPAVQVDPPVKQASRIQIE